MEYQLNTGDIILKKISKKHKKRQIISKITENGVFGGSREAKNDKLMISEIEPLIKYYP